MTFYMIYYKDHKNNYHTLMLRTHAEMTFEILNLNRQGYAPKFETVQA